MSRIYNEVCHIEYPNEMAYAGMPMVIQVEDTNNEVAGVGVTVKVGDNYYTETRTLYNGRAAFDISRYAQMAFVGKEFDYGYGEDYDQVKSSPLAQHIEVAVAFTDYEGDQYEDSLHFSVEALYGYIGIRQTNGGGVRKRRWFAKYPQTFDMYLSPSSEITLSIDGGEILDFYHNTSKEIEQVSVELSPWYKSPSPTSRSATLKATDTSFLNGGYFYKGYDTAYKLTIDHSTSGVYLRWLDHLGHWCHYLFRVTGRNYNIKEKQSWQDGVLRDPLVPEGAVYLASGQHYHTLSQEETIQLGAKLVDAEEFEYLLSIASSPMVEVMVNVDDYMDDTSTAPMWERVSIIAGSYSRTGSPLQDFIFSIARNPQTSQML